MADNNITIKRITGSGTSDNLYPRTTWTQVLDKPTTFTPTAHTHDVSDINATGTPDSTTFLRGDGVWADPDKEIVVYEASDSSRTTSTYTTDLEITSLEANSYYEVTFVGAYYKTSTDSAGFRMAFTVSNTTGTPTLIGDAEAATNTTTGRLPANIYAISSSVVTGSLLATTPETATTTRRHAHFRGYLYTGTSIKTFRLQTATSTTLTNGAVGLKAGSMLKIRKIN